MRVIDIPSSPEPPVARRTRSASRQPGPSRKRPRLAPPAREPSIAEIIELTDSDDDLPAPKRFHRQPGPSRPTPAAPSNAAPAFGKPDSGILADAPPPAPGPSQHVARREQQADGAPLFLPASDDEQHVVRPPPVPVAQDVPDAALAHPPPPPPEPPAPQAPAPVDPTDEYIVRVLEIVPDVQPTHALALIEQFMPSQPGNVVEFVLHALFENPSYPKVDKKGKHKQAEPDGDPIVRAPSPKVDYTSKARVYDCGPHYFDCSLVSNSVELRQLSSY
jgi:TRIAD3 protein (E3 ubiquitin-protein ligase RNF216)